MTDPSSLASLLRLHPSRLASAPEVRVTGREPGRLRLAVDGLVCGVCAARTRSALASLPGVEAVSVDLDRGTAEVRSASGTVSDIREDALRRALSSVVVGMGARRRLASLVSSWKGQR